MSERPSTNDPAYTERLKHQESIWWKKLLDVQRPYRRHLQSLNLGLVLDVGCGLGRNLKNLGGKGVGVDQNPDSVGVARARGFIAFVSDEFRKSEYASPGKFDALLFSHIIEHMRFDEAHTLIEMYLPFLRPGGRVLCITPQEAGFRSEPTHVELFDCDALARLVRSVGLEVDKHYSFPFPRFAGSFFRYNEFVLLARKPL
jgi:SAM-dependent methyltransferase